MENLVNAVDKHKRLILDAERYIWKNPETGYKEVKTTAYLAEKFIELGYELTFAEGITGFYTTIDTGKPGPTLLILGELDSIICPTHPEADPVTGAVHSCGHHAQCAALLGIAATLKEPNALDNLCGKIKLCAVPAEELLEIEYRSNLIEKGVIKYYGGKPEFLYRGYFDDVDLAFMVHTTNKPTYLSVPGAVGCIPKRIIYKGKATHAALPENCKNALYAATCGINACNAIRETFVEDDIIRFHPIITNGGAMVNAIPEIATIETYVRGKTFDAIVKVNKKVNQALIGAALSLNNNIEIIDNPGYAPHVNDVNMLKLAKDAFEKVFPGEQFVQSEKTNSGSTDMGDLSCIMPVVHPYACGATGTGHGNDYYITDPVKACINSAKWQVAMLYMLLENDAQLARKIVAEHKPRFASKKAYLDFMDSLRSKGDRIKYSNDKVEIIL